MKLAGFSLSIDLHFEMRSDAFLMNSSHFEKSAAELSSSGQDIFQWWEISWLKMNNFQGELFIQNAMMWKNIMVAFGISKVSWFAFNPLEIISTVPNTDQTLFDVLKIFHSLGSVQHWKNKIKQNKVFQPVMIQSRFNRDTQSPTHFLNSTGWQQNNCEISSLSAIW